MANYAANSFSLCLVCRLAFFDSSGTLRREPSGLLPEKSSSEMNSKDDPIWLLSASKLTVTISRRSGCFSH